jgi:hypothetical protein
MSTSLRGRPGIRPFELSYFCAGNWRNHARIVAGRTRWQQVLRSSGVRVLQVVNPSCRSLVNRVHNHRDDELERCQKHWAQTARARDAFSSVSFLQKSCAMGFRTVRVA